MKVTERGGARAGKFVVILSFISLQGARQDATIPLRTRRHLPAGLSNELSSHEVRPLLFHTGYTETLLYIRDDLKDYGLPVKPEQFAETLRIKYNCFRDRV